MSNKIELYYANWCGHCQRFKPVWEEMKPELKEMGVICSEYEDGRDESRIRAANIRGFPTLIITRNGKKEMYDGPRTKEAIIGLFGGQKGGGEEGQCGGGNCGTRNQRGGQCKVRPVVQSGGYIKLNLTEDDDDDDDDDDENDEYYKMKYYKYKAKYLRLLEKSRKY